MSVISRCRRKNNAGEQGQPRLVGMVAEVARRLHRGSGPPTGDHGRGHVDEQVVRSSGSPRARTATSLSISASIESRLTLPGPVFTWDSTSLSSASSPSAPVAPPVPRGGPPCPGRDGP